MWLLPPGQVSLGEGSVRRLGGSWILRGLHNLHCQQGEILRLEPPKKKRVQEPLSQNVGKLTITEVSETLFFLQIKDLHLFVVLAFHELNFRGSRLICKHSENECGTCTYIPCWWGLKTWERVRFRQRQRHCWTRWPAWWSSPVEHSSLSQQSSSGTAESTCSLWTEPSDHLLACWTEKNLLPTGF